MLALYFTGRLISRALDLFENETESINQIIEFGHSEEYSEREFELENVSGNNKVSFVFLPGSNYDFAWFEFT